MKPYRIRIGGRSILLSLVIYLLVSTDLNTRSQSGSMFPKFGNDIKQNKSFKPEAIVVFAVGFANCKLLVAGWHAKWRCTCSLMIFRVVTVSENHGPTATSGILICSASRLDQKEQKRPTAHAWIDIKWHLNGKKKHVAPSWYDVFSPWPVINLIGSMMENCNVFLDL